MAEARQSTQEASPPAREPGPHDNQATEKAAQKPEGPYQRTAYGQTYTVSKAARGNAPWSWVVPGPDGTPLHQGKDCASREEAEAQAEAAIQGV